MAHVRQHATYPQYRQKVGKMPDFSGSNEIKQEEPIGTKDGSNKTYTLMKTPVKNSEEVFKDGMFMMRGVDKDYTISGKIISFVEAPSQKCVIAVNYKTMEG
jgi:hypothetical protein